jgi:hypothetical protein
MFWPLTNKALNNMTLQEAHKIIEGKRTEASSTSETKIYNKFLDVLEGLKSRTFTNDEIHSIERELDVLDLESNPRNKKRYFKKALNAFESYLKDTFSLTLKGYYTKLGMALGTTFGMLFGIVVLQSWERSMGISLGWIFGMLIGLAIGKSMDAKAETEGRAL